MSLSRVRPSFLVLKFPLSIVVPKRDEDEEETSLLTPTSFRDPLPEFLLLDVVGGATTETVPDPPSFLPLSSSIKNLSSGESGKIGSASSTFSRERMNGEATDKEDDGDAFLDVEDDVDAPELGWRSKRETELSAATNLK